ncbi:MAG: Histidine kinase [Rhodospirillales bacterium]|nr:Histidine kinase [Rhodospirillales bacterium]
MPSLVLVIVGVALSFAAFAVTRRVDEARVRSELELRAEWRLRGIERKIAVDVNSLQATAVFVATQPILAEADFHRFARLDHDSEAANSGLLWSPFVRAADRAGFVAAVRESGVPDFDIVEPDGRGGFVSAAARDDYLPALFEENYDGRPAARGLDGAAAAVRRSGAELARDTGQAVATPPLPTYFGSQLALGFLVFWPVYTTGEVPPTVAERRQAFRGAAVSRYGFDRLLPHALLDAPKIDESIDFRVDRGGDGEEPMLVGSYDPVADKITVGAVAPRQDGVGITRSFAVLGRQWTLRFHFAPELIAGLGSPNAEVRLVLGLLLTAAIAGYFLRERRQRSNVESEVRLRTSELVAANRQLNQEIEERERAAVELRLWAHAFANAAFGIGISDPRTRRMRFGNPALATMLGMTTAEFEGLATIDQFPVEERGRVRAIMETVDRVGSVLFTTRHRRKDGTIFPVQMNVTSVRDVDGTVLYRIASILDITEAHRTEEALRQAQKMEAIGNLTGGMAHDFNNILAIIIGNLDLARPRIAGDAETDELVGECLESALRGADLTRRLLAFARRQPLRPRRFDVNELVANAVKLLRRLLDENVVISLDLPPETWPVLADPAQLEAALTNLATNARDAMPNGGTLLIATGNRQLDEDYAATHPEVVAGDYAMIEVSDTGSGMAPEVVSRIFEPFFTTKDRDKGTGLGLSMVFGFMKQSGGHVNVYSEPGVGTTFRLYLPRSGEAAEATSSAAPVAYARAAGETVLAVEDNAALLRVVVRQLEEFGYRVLAADGATAALTILASEPVDMLFTDVIMPGVVDGFALAREALALQPSIKVVLTSGFPEAKINGHLGPSGGSARLLSKPYRKEELAQVLRQVLDS